MSFLSGKVQLCSLGQMNYPLSHVTLGKSFYHCNPILHLLNGDKNKIKLRLLGSLCSFKMQKNNFENMFYVTQYIQNPIISTFDQLKLLISYLTFYFSYNSFGIQCVFYSTSQFRLVSIVQ